MTKGGTEMLQVRLQILVKTLMLTGIKCDMDKETENVETEINAGKKKKVWLFIHLTTEIK